MEATLPDGLASVSIRPACFRMETLGRRNPKGLARGFEEEPGAAFGFVNPDLNQAGSGIVIRFVRNFMSGAQAFDEGPIVRVEFQKHVAGRDELLIVVRNALQLGNVTDGANGGASDLAYALGDVVRDGEDLFTLLIEKKMVVAEMRTAHVPMEVLGL